ncbi:30S ribosomal protein S16 [Buchnera aphidicola]|uniref:Small ribosomal subunit protein bS16 n=1 Tax=Buchnera aphidicola subsp. Melaphis rhois TaxID=118103 RepID=A0A4D6YAW4_BUCMH|nr:30S ribosomal protein S16 [Buchnera aphidicola]QCI23571.1 30S ribosomal protein S16 [Buchnera aphidicola (Melaphis rhois)]
MIKIRLTRIGAKKCPFYQIIIADSRCPRNGKFIEKLGFFNPISPQNCSNIYINFNRLEYWTKNGAKISNRVKYLIKKVIREDTPRRKY